MPGSRANPLSNSAEYVNSMWEQQNPYEGDAVNSYNDGPPEPGASPLGPFYELETSSPALALAPGASAAHVHRTFHLRGREEDLDAVARKVLSVGLEEITSAFDPKSDPVIAGSFRGADLRAIHILFRSPQVSRLAQTERLKGGGIYFCPVLTTCYRLPIVLIGEFIVEKGPDRGCAKHVYCLYWAIHGRSVLFSQITGDKTTMYLS